VELSIRFKSVSRDGQSGDYAGLLDILIRYFVGAGEQRGWDGDAEHLRGLQVDDEFELGGKLNWQMGHGSAFKYLVYVRCGAMKAILKINSVANEPARGMMPVRLPLGRRKSLSDNPSAAGFPNAATTIGIVEVARLAASALTLALAKMTSGSS
jgi:hypothetical protein